MSGSSWEACRMSGRPSWLFGSHRENLPDVRQLLGGPPGYSGVVGRPSRISGSPFRISCSGRLAFPDVR